MSLINDALKRAKQAQQKHAPPSAGAPLRPAEPAPPVTAPRSLLLPILAAAMLVFVGGILIVVAFSRGLRVKSDEPVASRPAAVSVQNDPGKVAPLPHAADLSSATSGPAPAVTVPPVSTNPAQIAAALVSPAVADSNSVPVVPAPLEPQLPKLQGILFNPARPTAFLNGKSVTVGGRAGEYTVLAITKQAVTVERAGQTNVLRMEE
jgi:hypothetical protein